MTEKMVMPLVSDSPVIHKRVAKTRERVRQAAARLFNQKNFDAVTIEAIVQEADIARSTFYRLFSDKESLLKEIITPMFEQAEHALRGLDDDRPEAIINGIADSYLQVWSSNREALKLSQNISLSYVLLIKKEHDKYAKALVNLMRAIHDAKMLRNDDPYISAMLLAQTVIKMLSVCEKHKDFEQVFSSTLRGMLLKW